MIVVGNSVSSVSGILCHQERLDKQQVTARDPGDSPCWVGGKASLLETWLKVKYAQFFWSYPLTGRGRKRSENYFEVFFNTFEVWCFTLVSVCVVKNQLDLFGDVIPRDVSCICITISRGQSREELPHSCVEKVGRGVCMSSWLGLDWSVSKLVS